MQHRRRWWRRRRRRPWPPRPGVERRPGQVLLDEAAEVQDELHSGAAERTGEALRRDALPRRLHEGGAQPEAGAERGQGAGERTVAVLMGQKFSVALAAGICTGLSVSVSGATRATVAIN